MFNLPSQLDKIPDQALLSTNSDVWIKRDDLIHSVISGNKARKLYSFLQDIQTGNKPLAVLSMGGNRSNFLHALGYICYKNHIDCHAFIRGHQPKVFGRTLGDLQNWGVQLSFIDKTSFTQLRTDAELGLQKAQQLNALWLPEGGSNADALCGIIDAVNELDFPPDEIFVPVGTGCTALGLALGCQQRGWHTRVIGVVVLKGALELKNSISQLAISAGYTLPDNLLLEHSFCGTGFGKVTQEIKAQQQAYENRFNLPLEPVYSVKMLNAFDAYCREGLISDRVILWHTGGLQGN